MHKSGANSISPQPLSKLWAPRVRPEKIRRLYQAEARGILDEELIQVEKAN